MDEGLLNDLLECSVCLDRLDTSSKVLPCQHTFCRKCLMEIVQKHKELRCPECRVLVKCSVDELPPNVLLMRILEGMRNVGQKKEHVKSHTTAIVQDCHVVQNTTTNKASLNKQASATVQQQQSYAKALYDYDRREPGDLSFKRGDLILVRRRIDTHWYQGECGGKQGIFPLSYVQMITPLPSHVPQCKALYDFQTDKHEEEGCLMFKEGDIINVIRRVDENWAEGKLDGRIGIFPLTFVELNNLARSLMKLSTNAQPGPSRVAPPTPTTEESTPLIPTDHSRNVVSQHLSDDGFVRLFSAVTTSTAADSGATVSSASSSTTPNVSSSNTSSNSSTAPSSPASPLARNQMGGDAPPAVAQKPPDILLNWSTQRPAGNYNRHGKEKRHSFTGLAPPSTNGNKTRMSNSTEVIAVGRETSDPRGTERPKKHNARSHHNGSKSGESKLPSAYVALYPYKPQKADELELRKGSIYMVTERCQDGWFKGTSNRTLKCGVFPGNYVAPVLKIGPTQSSSSSGGPADPNADVSFTRSGKVYNHKSNQAFSNLLPPELPPRCASPATATVTNAVSSSWHGQPQPDGRSTANAIPTANTQHSNATASKSSDKGHKEKGSGGLMRRLASIKRSKSPPTSTFSMDNPVFEDTATATTHPVHVRSGSCPSQLLQIQPVEHHRMFGGSTSQRLKHKERPSLHMHNQRSAENPSGNSTSSSDVHEHRKSNSLDAENRAVKTGVQTVRELFRCEIPYPPNSEYELELQKDDLIYVHKKREDGWYKGTLQRTGRTGLFPASFVRPV